MKFISARDIVLSIITFFLIALAIFIVEESIRLWIKRKFLKNEKAR
jgi:large-conductance mechanosensitive channel